MNLFEYLGFAKEDLLQIDIPRNYASYKIRKHSGRGFRRIDAPLDHLKRIQTQILHKVLYRYSAHEIAHGFIKRRSPRTNAAEHVGKRYVVKLDIKDFFPTMNYDMLFWFFTRLFGNRAGVMSSLPLPFDTLEEADLNLLVTLLTLNNKLPQGSPASPAISNLYCYEMDRRLWFLQKTFDCVITRYADDITISLNSDKDIKLLVYEVTRILRMSGFRSNRRKLVIASCGRRQKVTGIVVNNKLNTPKESWRNLRAALHQAASHGNLSEKRQQQLRGQIEWLRSLNPVRGEKFLESLGQITANQPSQAS
jgi:RNA-directed DNA polymerase